MSSQPTDIATDLLDELQATLAHGTVARRVETLRRVTDLFIDGAMDYSDAQIGLFDDVFNCLVEHIETEAKALLSRRLAPIAQAPPRIIHHLAFDDLVEVAAPVLSQSGRLDDATLIRNARSRGPGHQMAIATRILLSEAVTDVLVEIGSAEVVRSAVTNPGAVFSERGYSTLMRLAEHDDDLATLVALRPSLPRHHYLKLIARASSEVQARLKLAHPQAATDIATVVREASRRARSAPTAMTRETTIAHGLVRSLFEDGRLDEYLVAGFADDNKFDETSAAIACLANVTVEVAESMMVESRLEGVLILAKVAGLSWSTAKAIVTMREVVSGGMPSDLEAARATYERLRPSTAQQVLRFHRMQHSSACASPAA
jgi:uncharacterized protein (DUF2336 family)